MSFFSDFLQYLSEHHQQVLNYLLEHIRLTAFSVGLAILIGVPLGILICYVKKMHKPILGFANVVQAIPSMALLGFAIPFLGIGTVPAIFTVVLYSLLPIIKNTYTGIESINPQTVEAGRGMGLTKLQILTKVQIPMALPIIMAGVRISAVTAVGLMTIAAFIGAGGLGQLVFSGIRTVNNGQILAGAIPACLLALLVDYLASLIERLVTPVSLQALTPAAKSNILRTKKRQKGILVTAAFCLIIVLVVNFVSGMQKQERVLTIGTKDFSEQLVLGHMVADLVEAKTDISVDRKINMGGTQVCFSALASGAIDLYVDYTGTVYGDTLKYPPISDMEEVYDTVKTDMKEQYDIEVLPQMQFNNTYTLSVTQETAKTNNLVTFSDLISTAKNLKAGVTFEFLNREDGMPGLTQAYGFQFGSEVGLDGSSRYLALTNGDVDIIDAFSTDGLLKKFDLVVLEDDQHFFPPYYAIPLMRNEAVQEFPEILPLLEDLGNRLTVEVMVDLNYRVDELQQQPEAVAKEFLKSEGLLP